MSNSNFIHDLDASTFRLNVNKRDTYVTLDITALNTDTRMATFIALFPEIDPAEGDNVETVYVKLLEALEPFAKDVLNQLDGIRQSEDIDLNALRDAIRSL